MSPSVGTQGSATLVNIIGREFVPTMESSFDDNTAEVQATFAARLGAVPLVDVLYVDSAVLSATVPASLGPGAHDLVVVTPDGTELLLTSAFVVEAAPSQTVVVITGATPRTLTANGVQSAQISLHIERPAGTPLEGANLSLATTGSGTFGPVTDQGSGNYSVTFVAPVASSPGTETVSVGVDGVQESVTFSLVPPCNADFVVDNSADFGAAVSGANAALGRSSICLGTNVVVQLQSPVTLTNPSGIDLRGEAGATLDGNDLSAGVGITLSADTSTVAHLVVRRFAGVALGVQGTQIEIHHTTFTDCDTAISIDNETATVGPANTFSDGDVAVRVNHNSARLSGNTMYNFSVAAITLGTLSQSSDAVIDYNLVYDAPLAIGLSDAEGVSIRHNTLVEISGDVVVVGAEAEDVEVTNSLFAYNDGFAITVLGDDITPPSHNAFFDNEGACLGCVLGSGTVWADPLFVDAGSDDYRLQNASPCVDAGLDLGETFLGQAPDIGAFERR